MSYSIPFNRRCLAGNQYKYIADAIAHRHASGDGPFTKKCHFHPGDERFDAEGVVSSRLRSEPFLLYVPQMVHPDALQALQRAQKFRQNR
jgi:hypothetical protein